MAQNFCKVQRTLAKKDKIAFIEITYDSMINRINGHKHPRYKNLPICTRDEFKNWALGRKDLHNLFTSWISGGHIFKQRPTIDRLNASLGYILPNMRWMTQSENSRLGGIAGRRKQLLQ